MYFNSGGFFSTIISTISRYPEKEKLYQQNVFISTGLPKEKLNVVDRCLFGWKSTWFNQVPSDLKIKSAKY